MAVPVLSRAQLQIRLCERCKAQDSFSQLSDVCVGLTGAGGEAEAGSYILHEALRLRPSPADLMVVGRPVVIHGARHLIIYVRSVHGTDRCENPSRSSFSVDTSIRCAA